jgi:uncharacterized membrane protein
MNACTYETFPFSKKNKILFICSFVCLFVCLFHDWLFYFQLQCTTTTTTLIMYFISAFCFILSCFLLVCRYKERCTTNTYNSPTHANRDFIFIYFISLFSFFFCCYMSFG